MRNYFVGMIVLALAFSACQKRSTCPAYWDKNYNQTVVDQNGNIVSTSGGEKVKYKKSGTVKKKKSKTMLR